MSDEQGECAQPSLPEPRTARDLDFHEHDYVCPACVHRQHEACDNGCRFCGSACLCVCRRWAIPVKGM